MKKVISDLKIAEVKGEVQAIYDNELIHPLPKPLQSMKLS